MYDISDTKVRNKVEKLLSSFGYSVNYSVFEIDITKSKFKYICGKLIKLTSKNDNIRIYILNKDVIKNSFTLHQKDIFEQKELYF